MRTETGSLLVILDDLSLHKCLIVLDGELLAALGIGKAKQQRLVTAIEHRFVEIFGAVRGQHEQEVTPLPSSVVEEGVERIVRILAHLGLLAVSQEGLGLVDEKEKALATHLGPPEEGVDLRHSVATERTYVPTAHKSKVHTGGLSQLLGHHGLPCTGRTIQ